MKKFIALPIVACILFSACGYKPPVQLAINNSFSIQAPFDKVWTGVIELFATRNWPITTIEKVSGIITTDWVAFPYTGTQQYSDCGVQNTQRLEAYRGRFNVFVKSRDLESNITAIQINVTFDNNVAPNSNTLYFCVSTGRLEAEVFDALISIIF